MEIKGNYHFISTQLILKCGYDSILGRKLETSNSTYIVAVQTGSPLESTQNFYSNVLISLLVTLQNPKERKILTSQKYFIEIFLLIGGQTQMQPKHLTIG